jgi:hypothetical protein
MAPFSNQDIDQLATQIKAAYQRRPPAHVEGAARDPKATFCEIWPSVHTGLVALEAVVGSIPGFGAIVKAAISIVDAAGQAAVKALCPST